MNMCTHMHFAWRNITGQDLCDVGCTSVFMRVCATEGGWVGPSVLVMLEQDTLCLCLLMHLNVL